MKLKTAFQHIILMSFLMIIIFAIYTGAAGSEPLPKAVVKKATIEFPPVIAGTEVTQVFIIQNMGEAILNIPGVYTE